VLRVGDLDAPAPLTPANRLKMTYFALEMAIEIG
jgi:hypothetical protein